MIEPQDLLVYARTLLDDSPDEIKRRASASRSYYGAYHYVANKYLEANNNNPSIESAIRSPVRLITLLKEEGDAELRTIGNQLDNLKKYRNHADYRISDDFDMTAGEATYSQANRIRNRIDKTYR